MARHPTKSRIAGWVALLLLLAMALPAALGAQSDANFRRAARFQAAYLRYLVEYTIWNKQDFPPKDGSLRMAVYGEDPHGTVQAFKIAISTLDLKADGRPIEITHFPQVQDPASISDKALRPYNLFFFLRSEKDRWLGLLPFIFNRSALLVSEIPGFAYMGGEVEFSLTGGGYGRLKMLVNLPILRERGLDLSSRLLSLRNAVEPVESKTAEERLRLFQGLKKSPEPDSSEPVSPRSTAPGPTNRKKIQTSGTRG